MRGAKAREQRRTMDVDEADKVVTAYKERVDRQAERLDTFLAFLDDTGQLEKFNEWEEQRSADRHDAHPEQAS